MKLCKTCGETKPLDQFHNDRSKADGKNFYCKPCMIAKQREYAARPARRPDIDGQRECDHCHTLKPLTEFYKDTRRVDGLSRRCKRCAYEIQNTWRLNNLDKVAESMKAWRDRNPGKAADAHIQKNYGLPPGSYDKMFTEQGGRCAICKTTRPGGKSGDTGRFHVDHCHDTGAVRGLLCHGCNVSIGHFNHDEEVLRSAIQYLAKARSIG